MRIDLLWIALPAALAATLAASPARADIYTWVDASGTINVSNIAPPDGVRVTGIIHASTPAATTGDPPGREVAREAQVRALTERVGQLEDEIAFAQRQVAPPVQYVVTPPPVVQYITDFAPQVQYVNPAPQASAGCDPSWTDCGYGWNPAFYPASILVLRPPHFARTRPFRMDHHAAAQLPMHMPSASLRRG